MCVTLKEITFIFVSSIKIFLLINLASFICWLTTFIILLVNVNIINEKVVNNSSQWNILSPLYSVVLCMTHSFPNAVSVFLPFWKATKSRSVIEPQYYQAYPRFLQCDIKKLVSVYFLHLTLFIEFVLQVFFYDLETLLGCIIQNEFH